MFFTFLFVAFSVITISPNCLADFAEIENYLDKSYLLVSSDSNFDKVLKELGVSWTWRKMYEHTWPTLKLMLSPERDSFTLSEQSHLVSSLVSFKLGVGVKIKTVDGRNVMTTFTLDGTTLVEKQKQTGKPELIIKRTFGPKHVKVKVEIDDIVSYRVYDIVPPKEST